MQPIQLSDHQHPPAEPFNSHDNKPTLATVLDTHREHGIPISTIYEMIAAGRAPGVVRFGRRIMIHRRIFSEWLEAQAREGEQL